ncbi:GNAT family N-acetyltransferase [Chitinilyticum litopenaei]|uniref:GNAT family N-acetyltransferase n=1 Tax=Chitinilyticum litopenaei TaxID=1121276 RepID=UPI000421A7ED|nr:GNAT family N-acetyltransferase [Chitinilyticum litopenaei]
MPGNPTHTASMLKLESLTLAGLHPQLLAGFVRHQPVTEAWRGEHADWRLQPVTFTEDWDDATLADIVASDFRPCLIEGGAVWLLRSESGVQAFAALCRPRFGSRQQYVQLMQLHVSLPWRGQGLGRRLLAAAVDQAREWGASHLYASAHSSRESAAFYFATGWVPAAEPRADLVEKEPCDLQLEYALPQQY